MAVKIQRVDKNIRGTLRELPYFDFRGDLASFHWPSNNCLSSAKKSKRNRLEGLSGLYGLIYLIGISVSIVTLITLIYLHIYVVNIILRIALE